MTVEKIVLPGDVIDEIPKTIKSSKITLGPGLRRESEDLVVACKAGILKSKKNTYWVDNHQKRYVPSRGEDVVGVVINNTGDLIKVDIGASEPAMLPYLAFESATKKNRPNVKIGDIVYAKLIIARSDMEPELVCVDSHGKKGRLGILSTDGFVFTCSLNLVYKILNPTCPLLETLSKEITCEITAGMNGRIWVKAKSVRATIAVINAILASEYKTNSEIKQMCKNVFSNLSGF